jgi:hypothetical protein
MIGRAECEFTNNRHDLTHNETVNPMFKRSVFLAAIAVSGLTAAPVARAGGQDRPDAAMAERVFPQWTIGSIDVEMSSAHLGLDALDYTAPVHDPALRMALLANGPFKEFGVGFKRQFHTQRTGAFSIGMKAGVVLPLAHPVISVSDVAVNDALRDRVRRYLRLYVGKPIGKRHRA